MFLQSINSSSSANVQKHPMTITSAIPEIEIISNEFIRPSEQYEYHYNVVNDGDAIQNETIVTDILTVSQCKFILNKRFNFTLYLLKYCILQFKPN